MAVLPPNKLTLRQRTRLFEQLATLLNGGFSVQQALSLAGQDLGASLQQCLRRASATVATGQDLATAFATCPHLLDSWTISLIRLAEYSGSLADLFQRLAIATQQQQRRQKLYRSVSLAAIAMVASLVLLIGVLLSRAASRPNSWLLMVGLTIGLVAIVSILSRRSNASFQGWLASLPIIGSIMQARSLLYFSELALPLSCGVSLLSALELLRDRIPDMQLKKSLAIASRQVRAGQPLSRSLQGKLTPTALQMIRTGEETGNLEGMLQKLAEYSEAELERHLRQLQSILRPLSLVAMGGFVTVLGIQMVRSLIDALPS